MGSSSCSIVNDTDYDVWMCQGVNWKVAAPIIAVVGVVGVIATAGMGLAAVGASVGVGGVLLGGSTAGFTIVGLTATEWTIAGLVTGLSTATLATAAGITKKEAEALQKYVRDFQEKSERIEPGGAFTWEGSLSSNKRVYVMNDKLETDNRGCLTAASAGGNNKYYISQHFTNLSVKREEGTTTGADGGTKGNDTNGNDTEMALIYKRPKDDMSGDEMYNVCDDAVDTDDAPDIEEDTTTGANGDTNGNGTEMALIYKRPKDDMSGDEIHNVCGDDMSGDEIYNVCDDSVDTNDAPDIEKEIHNVCDDPSNE